MTDGILFTVAMFHVLFIVLTLLAIGILIWASIGILKNWLKERKKQRA